MSVRPVEAYELRCDRCDDNFEDGDYTIFGGEVPWDNAEESEWWIGADWPPVESGPHYCPGCHDAIREDDDTLTLTVKPVPAPHALVRDPRWTSPVYPGEWCKADGCGLKAKHDVHQPTALGGTVDA
jgi:hypothetical protein